MKNCKACGKQLLPSEIAAEVRTCGKCAMKRLKELAQLKGTLVAKQ